MEKQSGHMENVDCQGILKDCREAGRAHDYDRLLHLASVGFDAAVRHHSANEDESSSHEETDEKGHGHSYLQFLISSFLGYKGYAYMKQGQWDQALPCLQQSKCIRDEIVVDCHPTSLPEKQLEVLQREGALLDEALDARKDESAATIDDTGNHQFISKPIKYPRTTHLFDAGGTAITPDDLVVQDLFPIVSFLSTETNGGLRITIEEKIDGSNLGFSISPITGEIRVQNRSHYIFQGDHSQYNRLTAWVAEHEQSLRDILLPLDDGGCNSHDNVLILYGEWLVARHSIPYHKLPGYFVAFDIYDKRRNKFLSRRRFHSIMKGSRIPVVRTYERKMTPYIVVEFDR